MPPLTPDDFENICEDIFEDLNSTDFIDQYLEQFSSQKRAAIKEWLKDQDIYSDLDLVTNYAELREKLKAEWLPFRN